MEIFLTDGKSRSQVLIASKVTKKFVRTMFPDPDKTFGVYVPVTQFVSGEEVSLVKITDSPIGFVERLGKRTKIPVQVIRDWDKIIGQGEPFFVVDGLTLKDEFLPLDWLEDWLLTHPLAKFPVGQVYILKKELKDVIEDLGLALRKVNALIGHGHTITDDDTIQTLALRLRQINDRVQELAR